nr:hypothetical protein [Tanacetum cinerariifolium]
MKIDPHHFNAESDLIESLLNHDSLIISSSSKIDSLLDEFVGELILLKSIPSRIDETNCDPEEEIRLIEKFDSLMEEIDLSLTPDDSMPPDIKEDDYDSERDMFILEKLLSNDSISLPGSESFHFDIPSSSRPPAKPPDDSGILTVKVIASRPSIILENYGIANLAIEGGSGSRYGTCRTEVWGKRVGKRMYRFWAGNTVHSTVL